jgi:hypothetical protein
MADDRTFSVAKAPTKTPPKDLNRLNAEEVAEQAVLHGPTLVSSPQTAPGRAPLFRN